MYMKNERRLTKKRKEQLSKERVKFIEERQKEILDMVYDDKRYIYPNYKGPKLLFYEIRTRQYFEATLVDVLKAEIECNKMFSETGVLYLSDYCKFLKIPCSLEEDNIYWEWNGNLAWISFDYTSVKYEDNLRCMMLDINEEGDMTYAHP